MKVDKYIKDISDRLDTISSNGNGNGHGAGNNGPEDYDYDEYLLDTGREPLRFAYYRHVRVQQCTDEYRKKSFECAHDSFTQDELDFYLKAKLRTPPEERYQDQKQNWFFHDTSYSKRGLEAYDGKGCNGFTGCVPECTFYANTGVIEDEKVIDEHNRIVESLRQENAIIDIDINTEDFFEFARNFYNR